MFLMIKRCFGERILETRLDCAIGVEISHFIGKIFSVESLRIELKDLGSTGKISTRPSDLRGLRLFGLL